MRRSLALLLILLAAACATTGGGPSMEARLASAPDDQARGKILYEGSCARCHALYMPSSFYADEWQFYVKKYGRRSRLNKGQRVLVFEYLAEHARE